MLSVGLDVACRNYPPQALLFTHTETGCIHFQGAKSVPNRSQCDAKMIPKRHQHDPQVPKSNPTMIPKRPQQRSPQRPTNYAKTNKTSDPEMIPKRPQNDFQMILK